MSYLGESDIIYSDVIDSFISEIMKYQMSVIVPSTESSDEIDKFISEIL